MLVLVLDHTCRRPDWDWYVPLAPYLQWAYALRASVGIVEVGGAGAASELRAEQFRSRSLLDPRVASALERAPGRATPLAHGLNLAAQMLRHDTQQGNASVSDALLLVVTDGRGNVPLAASYATAAPARVAREGVEDALDAARAISTLHRVRGLVIDPGPRPYGHLTTMLAEALGGPVIRSAPGGALDDG
jgi:magnesium chelatase subunit D